MIELKIWELVLLFFLGFVVGAGMTMVVVAIRELKKIQKNLESIGKPK